MLEMNVHKKKKSKSVQKNITPVGRLQTFRNGQIKKSQFSAWLFHQTVEMYN